MQQELLEVEQVPRRLRRVRCVVGVRMVLQRRVEQRGDREEADQPEHGHDELDDQEVRPHHGRVLHALVHADDRVLPDEREQPEALLLLPRNRVLIL